MNNLPSFEQIKKEITAFVTTVENEFLNQSEQTLNFKANADSWSVLECIEHLNKYCVYYNQETQRAIDKCAGTKPAQQLKLSWFGKKSIQMVQPGSKAMKTMKRMDPQDSALNKSVLEDFIKHQKELLKLVDKAQKVNFLKKKVRLEFMKLLRHNIYETLVFMLVHQQRHIGQALRALDVTKNNNMSLAK